LKLGFRAVAPPWAALLRAALTAGALLSLPGCASWPTWPGNAGDAADQVDQSTALLAAPHPDLPDQASLPGVPFFAQTALQCGPAALATVLGAAGLPTSPEQLAPEVFVPARGGSLQIEMLAAARRHGAVSTRLPPELGAVLREVAAGHPVVVLLNLGLSWYPVWHYAVLVGYDLPRRELLLRSGQTRELALPLFTFEHTWARSQRWAFVALPPAVLPAAADEPALVQGRTAFERAAPPDQAMLAYQAALQRWPGNLTLGLGLGNATQATGDTAGAAVVFERLARQQGSAVAWNNLAMARLKLGDGASAVQAARQAVQRAHSAEPAWLSAAQATLADVLKAVSTPISTTP
jgi:hypothetical protein